VEDFHERSIHTFGVPNNTGGGSSCKKNAAMSELYRHDATCWQHWDFKKKWIKWCAENHYHNGVCLVYLISVAQIKEPDWIALM